MKILSDYVTGEIEDVILLVEDCTLPLISLGCFPVGEDGKSWVKILPMAKHLEQAELEKSLQSMLDTVRKIKSGRKKLRFALNYVGADVCLSPGFLSGLASAKCSLEMAVVPLAERQKLSKAKREFPQMPDLFA